MHRVLQIKIESGLCLLNFRPEVSTGPKGCDTSPGIGFDYIVEPELFPDKYGLIPGKCYQSGGVMSRTDAAKLHTMLGEFLKKHPPKKGKK